MFGTLQKLYAEGGIPRFYRGLLPALIQVQLSIADVQFLLYTYLLVTMCPCHEIKGYAQDWSTVSAVPMQHMHSST